MISILIVDDEALIRDTLIHHIQWEELGIGCVLEAKDGEEALALIKQQTPDILLTDIKMPHVNGIELACSVRRSFPDVMLVFLSGHTDKEYLMEAIHLHVDGYIEKPLNLTEIKEKMSALANECRTRRRYKEASLSFYGKQLGEKERNTRFFELSQTTLLQFRKSLKNENRDTAIREIRAIINDIRESEGTPPVYVRNVFAQFAVEIQNAAARSGADQTMSECSRYINDADKASSFDVLEQGVVRIVHSFFDEISSLDLNPVSVVNSYIQKNYTNSTITVEKIAADLFFNTSYLCTIYKQQTGTTINQALRAVRIKAACDLLMHSNCKLYEIGAMVGYPNGKYFTRVFLKETGFSPREYRRLHYETH